MSLARDRSQSSSKGIAVVEGVGIVRYVRMKVFRILREAPLVGLVRTIHISKYERTGVSVSMMIDDVDINIETVGPHHGGATLQEFAGSVSRRHSPSLIFRTKIVVVKGIIAAGYSSTGAFQGRRKP